MHKLRCKEEVKSMSYSIDILFSMLLLSDEAILVSVELTMLVEKNRNPM